MHDTLNRYGIFVLSSLLLFTSTVTVAATTTASATPAITATTTSPITTPASTITTPITPITTIPATPPSVTVPTPPTTLPDAYHFRRAWFNAALGVGGNNDFGGLSGELSGNLRVSRNWLFTGRLNRLTKSPIIIGLSMRCALSGVVPCPAGQNYVGDAGLLFGYIFHGTTGYVSLSTGLAYVRGYNINSSGQIRNFKTAGFPFETQTFWTPNGYVGLGLIAFADLNNSWSYAGAMLALQIGTHQKNDTEINEAATDDD